MKYFNSNFSFNSINIAEDCTIKSKCKSAYMVVAHFRTMKAYFSKNLEPHTQCPFEASKSIESSKETETNVL